MTTRIGQARRSSLVALATLWLTGCVVGGPEEGTARDGLDVVDASDIPDEPLPAAGEEPEPVVGTPVSIEPHVLHDAGEACFYANETPFWPGAQQVTEFDDGDQLVVQVVLPDCLSTSCTTHRQARCRITHDGHRLHLETWFSYADVDNGMACTADCQQLVATCASDRLDAGEYEVVFGDEVAPLAVPSRFDACPEPPTDEGQ
jgi:hypothetical protein